MKKKFLILWLVSILSTLIALPYIFTLQSSLIKTMPISVWQLVLISTAQTALLLAIAIFFGLKISNKIKLSSITFLEAGFWSKNQLIKTIKLSACLGILVAIAIKTLDFFFLKYIPELAVAIEKIAFWKALLVAPYGGIVGELLMRLFLVSLFAWLIGTLFRKNEIAKNTIIMWTAIILASIIFGIGHLPATSTIVALTPLVILRALLLNGIGGLVFGWLYWKKGLEYAIIAHFTTDIVLHALMPLLLK